MSSGRSGVFRRVPANVMTPLVVGLGAFVVHRSPALLVAPVSCPGLAEWAAIAFAHARPDAPLGLSLLLADRVVFATGVALMARLVARTGGGWIPALATSAALLVLPLLEPRLAPFWSASFLVSVVTMAMLVERRAWFVCALLAAGAALQPQSAAVLAALGAAAAALHLRTAAAALRTCMAATVGLAIVGAAIGAAAMVPKLGGAPSLSACMLVPRAPIGRETLDLLVSVPASAGPYAVALAALGAFTWRARLQRPSDWLVLAYALSPLAGTFFVTEDPARRVGPFLVAFWILAAAGLREVVDACRARRLGQFAAPIFLVLVPLLVFAWRPDSVRPARVGHGSHGHERLSRLDVERIRVAVPESSAYVAEEAAFDLLLRASVAAWSTSVPVPEVVPVDSAAIGARLGQDRGPLLAMPLAQGRLQHLGFTLSALTSVPGVAAVQSGAPCAVLGTAWRDLSALRGTSALSILAREEAEAGPVVIYVQTQGDVLPRAIDWPERAMRGFVATYYLAKPADRGRLARDAQGDGLPEAWLPPPDVPVARLELWRIPDAPKILAVSLEARMDRAIGHVVPDNNPTQMSVCPSFPYTIQDFEPVRR